MTLPCDYDIAIIGDGITGLSAAFHLQKLGFSRLCFFSQPQVKSSSLQSAGFISGGLLDNFTRLSHPHGLDHAKTMWEFADTAYDSLLEYLQDYNILHLEGQRLRWLISETERIESKKAIEQLSEKGLSAQWIDPEEQLQSHFASKKLLGMQSDGPRAGWVQTSALLDQLSAQSSQTRFGEAKSFQLDNGQIHIQHQAGTVRTEFLICAQHLSIGTLLPNLAEALVPYADQWSEYRLRDHSKAFPWKAGTVFSWQHGHIWGVITAKDTLHIGGARYLRPMAGIEALQSTYEKKIIQHLAEAWNGLWPNLAVEPTGRGHATRECRPCDELPLIGPMFGEGRILLATGYMGQGLTLGFMAGRCLAELIADQPTKLPRMLWPERLRSLPNEAGDGST